MKRLPLCLRACKAKSKSSVSFYYLHIETKSVYRSDRDKYDNLEKICCECGDVINMASEIVDKIDGMVGENDA